MGFPDACETRLPVWFYHTLSIFGANVCPGLPGPLARCDAPDSLQHCLPVLLCAPSASQPPCKHCGCTSFQFQWVFGMIWCGENPSRGAPGTLTYIHNPHICATCRISLQFLKIIIHFTFLTLAAFLKNSVC